jgi:hypothetical protein
MKKFLHPRKWHVQTSSDQSFIGGIPHLPPGTRHPTCGLCGADLTFFFQVAFPASHPWRGHSLALFTCITGADQDHLIPDMLDDDELKGAIASRQFLETYQKAFRLFVFESAAGEALPGYRERVAFAPLELQSAKEGAIGILNDKPKWEAGNETPGKVAGSPPVFLLQVLAQAEFPTVNGAPPLMVPGSNGKPRRSLYEDRYYLFSSGAVYFFGPKTPDPAVYVLVQRG